MNTFNKKYNELLNQHNLYKENNLIIEWSWSEMFNNVLEWTKEKVLSICKSVNVFFKKIKELFDSITTVELFEKARSWVLSLFSACSNKNENIVQEDIDSIIITEDFKSWVPDWLQNIITRTNNMCNVLKSDSEQQKFFKYLNKEKHINNVKDFDTLSISQKKNYLYDFLEEQENKKNPIGEESEIISEVGILTVTSLVLILAIMIMGLILFNKIRDFFINGLPKNDDTDSGKQLEKYQNKELEKLKLALKNCEAFK